MRPVRLLPLLAGVALAALSGGVAAAADGSAERRTTCEPVMTVLRADCSVENHYVCPDGSHYSESLEPDGSVGAELSDSDYNLIQSFDLTTGEGVRGILETRRALSLSELITTGRTSADYTVALLLVFLDPRPARATFDLEMTDATRTIDGVDFSVVAARLGLEVAPGQMATMEGTVLVDLSRELMVTDEATMSFGGTSQPTGDAVTDVILPGGAGFMPESVPLSCQGVLSLLPQGRSHG